MSSLCLRHSLRALSTVEEHGIPNVFRQNKAPVTLLIKIEGVVVPARIPKDPLEVERYEAYLEKYSVADTLIEVPPMSDIEPKDKELEDYEFAKPQFYIRRVGVKDPKDDILVGPTYKDIHLEDRTVPPMAPATAAAKKPAKKPEEKSDSESSSEGSDTEEELKEPKAKRRKRGKQTPRKSAVTSRRPSRHNKDVDYKGQC